LVGVGVHGGGCAVEACIKSEMREICLIGWESDDEEVTNKKERGGKEGNTYGFSLSTYTCYILFKTGILSILDHAIN
jgi:hypothetical protein